MRDCNTLEVESESFQHRRIFRRRSLCSGVLTLLVIMWLHRNTELDSNVSLVISILPALFTLFQSIELFYMRQLFKMKMKMNRRDVIKECASFLLAVFLFVGICVSEHHSSLSSAATVLLIVNWNWMGAALQEHCSNMNSQH